MQNRTCERCNGTSTVISDFISCHGDCKRSFHYNCAGLLETSFRKMSQKSKKKWKCNECSVETPSLNKSENLHFSDDAASGSDSHGYNNVLQGTERGLDGSNVTTAQLNKDVELLSTQYSELSITLKDICEQIGAHQTKINEADRQINFVKQSLRNNSIEIHGLVLKNTATSDEIRRKIVELSECFRINGFSGDDIDIVYALRPKNNLPKPLVVQFKSRSIRNKWIANRKLTVINSQLPGGSSSLHIYINESLGPYFKTLWYEARKHAKDMGFKFVWVKDGKLYIRANEFSDTKRINCLEDLTNFVEMHGNNTGYSTNSVASAS